METRLRVEVPNEYWRMVKRAAESRRMSPARLARHLLLEFVAAEIPTTEEEMQRFALRLLIGSGFKTIANLAKASGLPRAIVKARLEEMKRETSSVANSATPPESSSLPSPTNHRRSEQPRTGALSTSTARRGHIVKGQHHAERI